MLDLNFYSRGTKPYGKKRTYEWATICSTEADYEEKEENDSNEFGLITDCIEGINVFKSHDIEQNWLNENLLKSIQKIIREMENQPEVILISTINIFMKAVHFSESSEMDPKMMITEDRTPVYYAMIGEDKCSLLIAWDEYYEDEE